MKTLGARLNRSVLTVSSCAVDFLSVTSAITEIISILMVQILTNKSTHLHKLLQCLTYFSCKNLTIDARKQINDLEVVQQFTLLIFNDNFTWLAFSLELPFDLCIFSRQKIYIGYIVF